MVEHLDDVSKAAHPNCMYLWMDHMMSPEANAARRRCTSMRPRRAPRPASSPRRSRGHCEQTHASDEAYWEDVWYWSTARADCADTQDSATSCVDYDKWVEAWTTLRGG